MVHETCVAHALEMLVDVAIKTGDKKYADTDDWVTLKVCDVNGEDCCRVALDDKGVNDMKKGAINYYTTKEEMGDCHNWNFNSNINLTFSIDGTDGWFVEWAEIRSRADASLSSTSFTRICRFDKWLDDNSKVSSTCKNGKFVNK